MPNMQPNYNQTIGVAVAGQLADFELHNVISRVLQDSTMAFGAVVSRGTADDQVKNGGSAATGFLGIALIDVTVRAENSNVYAQNDVVAVLTRGLVWVNAAVAVTPGQQAYFDASGNITNVATSNTIMPNCFFDSTATGAGLARLRLK